MPRTDVSFPSGGGSCAAWLYVPDSAPVSGPMIVMAHGLGGVRQMHFDAFAERFSSAGYRCLVFDYRHFGASPGEPRQLLSVRRQLEDWRNAITYARQSEGVDPDRIVLWGTSFAGGHVIRTAARDPRVAAVISQCPFTDGFASTFALPPKVLAKIAALAGIEALIPPGDQTPSGITARFGADIVRYFPGRDARKIQCPAHFAVCEDDSLAPPGPTLRHVWKAPRGEVRMQPGGHFDIYVGDAFERNVAQQLDFLARHVPTGHGGAD